MNKFNRAKKKKFLIALQNNNGNVSATCDELDMPRSTFYLWKEQDDDFAKEVDDVYERLIDEAEDALKRRISSGDTTAIIFFLKTRGKKRGYVEKQEVEHNVKDATTIIVKSAEEKDKLDNMGGLNV